MDGQKRCLIAQTGLQVIVLLIFKKNDLKAAMLFHTMKEDGMTPNMDTYAAILYAYHKLVLSKYMVGAGNFGRKLQASNFGQSIS